MKKMIASIILAGVARSANAGSWGFDNFDMNPNMNWGNKPVMGQRPRQRFQYGQWQWPIMGRRPEYGLGQWRWPIMG